VAVNSWVGSFVIPLDEAAEGYSIDGIELDGWERIKLGAIGSVQAILTVVPTLKFGNYLAAQFVAARALFAGGFKGLLNRELYVYLTEAQFAEVTATGQLGKGWTGTKPWNGFWIDEGRIWVTSYSPSQLTGSIGRIRMASTGMGNLASRTHVIRITGEAAKQFSKMGPHTSINPFSWVKAIPNIYQFQGTLKYAGNGVISSTAGMTIPSNSQLILYVVGEGTRGAGYTVVFPMNSGRSTKSVYYFQEE